MASAPATTVAIDPVCGMEVAVVAGGVSVEHRGETYWFCCTGCKTRFVSDPEAALAGGRA
jgi:Cu+-exporting ATPase